MAPPRINTYIGNSALGEPIINTGLSRVLSSTHPRFKAGDVVVGYSAFSEYEIVGKERADKPHEERGFSVLENPLGLDEKLYLGALGLSGLTAYSSLYAIGKPKKGKTIFISATSGAVGQIVGQLAKREGLRVLGSVGSDEKLNFITEELGFDGGFNYKKEGLEEGLGRVVGQGKGVDIYYDNVGGEMLDTALVSRNPWGRVVNCGNVSETSKLPSKRYGLKNSILVVGKRLSFRGFIVTDPDMGPVYHTEHLQNVGQRIKSGELTVKIGVTDEIDSIMAGMERYFLHEASRDSQVIFTAPSLI